MMVNHNSLPNAEHTELDPATAEAIKHAQIVKFAPPYFEDQGRLEDAGEYHFAVLCREPGDTLTFGITTREAARDAGGDASWMDLGTGGIGAVWVVTGSGNRYGIGNGYVYNHNAGGAYTLDPNASQLQLRVGQGAFLPGAGTTGTIKSILIGDEMYYGDIPSSWTGKDVSNVGIVNEPVDPLLDVRAIGDAVSRDSDPSLAVGKLVHDVSELRGSASFV